MPSNSNVSYCSSFIRGNMARILVLIDGFNFYHRLKDYQYRFKTCVKWLNYKSLMLSYFKDETDKENVYDFKYFSAIAEHRGEDCCSRHKIYIEALKSENIDVILGKFKEKNIPRCKCNERCTNCNSIQDKTKLTKHEEKNTDVNIAITLVEKALLKEYDTCYILSSDSDFNTAIKRAKELYPKGKIVLVPPPIPNNSKRNTPYYINSIKKLTGNHPLFVSWNTIKKAQFPDMINDNIVNPWQVLAK